MSLGLSPDRLVQNQTRCVRGRFAFRNRRYYSYPGGRIPLTSRSSANAEIQWRYFEAVRLALGYIFSTGLHRISVRVMREMRAIGCYRKCGFQVEDREREAALVDGRWQDDIIMGVLEGEFVRAST
jgi:RimJ/RimL family protein N-acetyltransferase